jgi:hypothetical protein
MAAWPHPYRLGRQKPDRKLKTPAFGDFLRQAKSWPKVKPMGWQYAVDPKDLLMLGNDTIGDCGPVGLYHWAQTASAHTDNPLHGTLDQVLSVYTAVSGYDPNAELDEDGNNPTDVGTNLEVLLSWVKQNGLPIMDKTEKEVRMEIEGWAGLDMTSVAQMRYSCYIFGGNYLGVNLPKNAMLDLTNWVWDPKSPIVGGHCINQGGEGSAGGHLQSWAKNIPFTWEFLLNTLEEAWIIVSKAWVDHTGKAPSGLDLDGLLAAMKGL